MRSSLGVSWLRRSRLSRWLCALSAWLPIALCAPSALAQAGAEAAPGATVSSATSDRARVILLGSTSGDEGVIARVRAELSRSSWRILELRVDERAGRPPLSRVAAAENVRAAVRFDAGTARVELWTSGPAGEVEEILTSGDDGADEVVLSYRVTETLRARGFEFDDAAATNAAPAAPPANDSAKAAAGANAKRSEQNATRATTSSAAPAVPAVPRGLAIEAAAGLDPGLGSLSPAVTAWLGAQLEFHPGWSAGVFASIPVAVQHVSASEGSAEISTLLAGVAADFSWVRGQRFRVRSGLGVAGAWSSMHGDAAAGYLDDDDSVTALVPFAHARAELALHPRFWLWAGALAGVAFPEIVVQFAEQQRADYGRPALLFALGLNVLAVPIR